MPTVNIYEAKTQLSKLVELAAAGSDVVIARAGKPVAKLTANEPKQRNRRMIGFGALEGEAWIADHFDAPLPTRFRLFLRADGCTSCSIRTFFTGSSTTRRRF